MQNRIYALNHAPINFYFSQNTRDFMVREVPLYPFSKEGEHHILNIRKKGLNTQEVLKILSCLLGCKKQDFGYAGLKDKSATTTQFISINKKFTKNLSIHLPILQQKGIKILDQTYHCNKIKLGHLKGNYFFIRLKKITPLMASQIIEAIEIIKIQGLPNYFGYQRFGKFQNNHLEGQKIAQKLKTYRDKTLQKFLLSSYQSHFFNQWLSQRMKINKIFNYFDFKEISKALKIENIQLDPTTLKDIKAQPHFFKILKGDLLMHYPFGKLFYTDLSPNDTIRFFNKNLSPTGILYGKNPFLAGDDAYHIEKNFFDHHLQCHSTRRYAWVWAEDISYRFLEEKAWFELEFFLPKGSYATIFIEELAHQKIQVD